MLDPLSDSRRNLLLTLKLCTRSDLRRAGRQVRRLARDLPAFDSVWLDALVRLGRLTPFQAGILESSQPEQIRLGPCVLISRLGGGPRGSTCLASTGPANARCVVKVLDGREHLSVEAEERLLELVKQLRGLQHPSVSFPMACERVGEQVALVSRFAEGLHLGELLVRRGRFPAAVVWEIARQLASGLQALEERQIVHGDIRAANVRLSRDGWAVLVDTGIRGALDAELSVHSGLAADRYDGIAPERIGTVSRPTVASDMYALGCLLWQLLAGRPPFPGGDPLIKLAAHQTRTLDDVRKWAPETPAALAEGIRQLTARHPEDRPAHFAEVLARWDIPRRSGRRRLVAFRRWFDAPAPLPATELVANRGVRRRRFVGMLLFGVLLAAGLQHQGARNALLSWSARLPAVQIQADAPAIDPKTEPESDSARLPGREPQAAVHPRDALPELPAPDQQGIVKLSSGKRYRAGEISAVGGLTIQADGREPAAIVVDTRPLKLTAEGVRLENLTIQRAERSPESISALILIQSQSLLIDRCTLKISRQGTPATDANASSSAPESGMGVAWKLIDPRDPQGGSALVRNSILSGGEIAVYFVHSPRRAEFANVLRQSGGPLAHFATLPDARRESLIRLERTTLRAGSALFRFAESTEATPRGEVSIDATDCVFDLAPPDGCLFELIAATSDQKTAPERPRPRISLTGEGSLVPETLVTSCRIFGEDRHRTLLETAGPTVEGLLGGPYRFAGTDGMTAADSEIRDYEAPRRSTEPPGIRAVDLPPNGSTRDAQ